jgi:hypothetical protein
VSPVKYELRFYIPEDDILHSRCHENLKSYKHSSCFCGPGSKTSPACSFKFIVSKQTLMKTAKG